MEIFAALVEGLMGVMSVWLIVLLLWQVLISFFGFSRKTKNYQDHEPEKRFLVLVPAHNEEKVIGDIINNLSHMDYPREMYDFYILADNCTDHTADVARSMGANVLEFFKDGPDAPTGKPIALQKALNALEGYQDKYDLVMFFDADNLADPNMFREVNSQFVDANGKADIIQCYLGAKNRKGMVALFYYMSYTITNRFFQFAKSRMGLNSVIGGTGFAVSAKYLHSRGGWTAMSLTEDFELQIEATCEGRRILWNNNVRIYDEKPTRFRASFRQRTRWAQGHWFVAFKNTGRLFKSLVKGTIKPLEFFSTFLYMYSLTPFVVLVIELALGMVMSVLAMFGLVPPRPVFVDATSWFTGNLPSILLFFYSFVFLFYMGEWMDNRIRFDIKVLPGLLVSMLINTVVAGWAQVVGLFKHRQQSKWVKTEHSMDHSKDLTVSLSDVGLEEKNK
ncbi:MAG: glycosyltransferase family 2 protein [Clostridia bacterium]|nr:glycosyltransferase family 2 protein [Clostridia bacterium]